MVQETERSVEPVRYNRDQHSISRRDIDADALKIMYRLLRNDCKAFLVGGGVRDLLLNKRPKDFDIATDATPRRIKSIFRNSRIIGRRFKLVHVYFPGNKIIEVSTFRDVSELVDDEVNEDSDSIKQISDNKYGSEMTDALRRDITINGLFYDLSTFSIIDYVGGVPDLQARIIRVIGDPDVRFKEDPVRMIRAVRHAAKADFNIEQSCWNSILKNKRLILQSPSMRVYEELKKDLCSGHLLKIFRLLSNSGLLELLLPEISTPLLLDTENDFTNAVAVADEKVLSNEKIGTSVILALIALYSGSADGNIAEIKNRLDTADKVVEHLKNCFSSLAVPRKERERVETILVAWSQMPNLEQNKINQLARRECLLDFKLFLNLVAPHANVPDLSNSNSQRHRRNRRSGRRRRRNYSGERSSSHRRIF